MASDPHNGWSNKDPRDTLTYGRYNIVVLRPGHQGLLDWAGTGQVNTKHGWDIRTDFDGHCAIDDWDPLWWWTLAP